MNNNFQSQTFGLPYQFSRTQPQTIPQQPLPNNQNQFLRSNFQTRNTRNVSNSFFGGNNMMERGRGRGRGRGSGRGMGFRNSGVESKIQGRGRGRGSGILRGRGRGRGRGTRSNMNQDIIQGRRGMGMGRGRSRGRSRGGGRGRGFNTNNQTFSNLNGNNIRPYKQQNQYQTIQQNTFSQVPQLLVNNKFPRKLPYAPPPVLVQNNYQPLNANYGNFNKRNNFNEHKQNFPTHQRQNNYSQQNNSSNTQQNFHRNQNVFKNENDNKVFRLDLNSEETSKIQNFALSLKKFLDNYNFSHNGKQLSNILIINKRANIKGTMHSLRVVSELLLLNSEFHQKLKEMHSIISQNTEWTLHALTQSNKAKYRVDFISQNHVLNCFKTMIEVIISQKNKKKQLQSLSSTVKNKNQKRNNKSNNQKKKKNNNKKKNNKNSSNGNSDGNKKKNINNNQNRKRAPNLTKQENNLNQQNQLKHRRVNTNKSNQINNNKKSTTKKKTKKRTNQKKKQQTKLLITDQLREQLKQLKNKSNF
ncbi:hypothetical protein M0812_00867 [Anaeramoeba flamelloides]|uniref:Uncharacterized protein n=1 Tax=Anaeramoeba flamelloides TaxID=1746091 RepID=A0AAV8A285_9EUKA|nr:hypothetical protein M0812_00867 [Anaeramoeba flamelloides]